MIKFRHRKIGINDVHEIYMIHLKESKSFCHTPSKATARKTCQILESITECQDPKNWKRQTLKRVQQIVRLMNRINHWEHTYPIPFESLEKILGWELAALTVTGNYKKQIAMYKLGCNEAKRFSSKFDTKEILLEDLTHWVTEPIGYIYDSEKGEYQKNP
jgi:hypothetical protein